MATCRINGFEVTLTVQELRELLNWHTEPEEVEPASASALKDRDAIDEKLSTSERTILRRVFMLTENHPYCSQASLANETGGNASHVSKSLKKLAELGLVNPVKIRGSHTKKYWRVRRNAVDLVTSLLYPESTKVNEEVKP